MKFTHLLLIFIILVGSDLFIGFYGHYVGSTDETVPTIGTFLEYIQSEETHNHLIYIILISIIVLLLLRFLL